jgi:(2S)-methylsuccinyl-CoA dehydrogenase
VAPAGRGEQEALNREQCAAHAFAWMASYVSALRQLRNWAGWLDDAGSLGETESLILQIVYGEYIAHLAGGIPMAPRRTNSSTLLRAAFS